MFKYFIILFIFINTLFGCSLCSIYSPKTHIQTIIQADKTYIKKVKIKWTFASEFTKELIKIYDTNLDNILNKEELVFIEDSLISYIKPKNYLTFISYGKEIKEKSDTIQIIHKKIEFKNDILFFSYEFNLDYKIIDKYKLYLEVYDEAGYFIMLFTPKEQFFKLPYRLKKELEVNSVTYTINAPNLEEKKKEIIKKKDIRQKSKKEVSQVENTFLDSLIYKTKKYLLQIEKGEDTFALFFLLLASFLYGIVHSLGPGHGKALAFSYFSSQKSSYFEAFVISLATGLVHIIGALVLVLISVFILQSVFSSFLNDSIFYITSFSAILIMFLSLYILYNKFRKKSCSCSTCTHEDSNKVMFSPIKQDMNFVKINTQIHIPKSRTKQDLIFVIFAGIIPCPGTVVLFVYAFVLKTYFSVILASIAISLGMGFVIFLSSFLGVSLNKTARNSAKWINIIEILAPIFMFVLGLLLLLNAGSL